MSNLRSLAMDATVLSALMSGREKITTEEIMTSYPDGVTIVACDWVPDENGETYPIFLIKEEPKKFYCGGVVLHKVVDAWEESLGSIDAVNDALNVEDGIKIRLEAGKTKKNQNITKVTIL